jgi:type VI secretion system protein VasD
LQREDDWSQKLFARDFVMAYEEQIRLIATLNPDLNGRPSPIVLRLMALKHPAAFENADFFSLYQRPREALAPDLITVEEQELRPGETRDLKLSVEDGTRYVGVVAAYRNLPETSWRFVIPLDVKGTTRVKLALDDEGIRRTGSEP